ncbi:hypothetical protein F7734_59105 [Scytonema sp. UIC 10036]|uniref:hypothetical protein n=1 Tax=Scytonema sp. UIC 10036 TaxID=2304196 RepID=UPI0012DACAAA|nr:hypothetical protein [Scytonema sp. UIC 10036]MUH01646.1 hypothetical protein [Scytonema sp. UIC 10036]
MAKIIINEFYRGGTLTAGYEFIELLLVEDLTSAQLAILQGLRVFVGWVYRV